jgi:PAS domain S-box-containing protein
MAPDHASSKPIWTREDHFSALVQHSFDAIISKDLNGVIRSWNPAAERMLGWSSEEVIGKPIRLIIPSDRQQEEDDILHRINNGETIAKFETIRQHKSGRPVLVALSISPLRDERGAIVGASKIAHDISESVEARKRLEENELQFRILANSIPQLAWMADGRGLIFWYNDRWYDYTGTTLDQMKGWGWTSVHHPDHVERVRSRIQESWDSGRHWEDTFPLRGRDGEYRWFLSRAVPLLDRDGKVWRWFGTNTDITIQRENEEQIQLLMGELSHRAKNMIAVVQALVSRTADRKYAESLAARLSALARNQDILTRRNWKGAPIGELIASQLVTAGDLIGKRVFMTGDLGFVIGPSSAEAIGLAIHELATNAAKYGALSNMSGEIQIEINSDRAGGKLSVEWREIGGPPVVAPGHAGFGTVMIDRNPRLALGAEVAFGYPEDGFYWRLTAPIDRISETVA